MAETKALKVDVGSGIADSFRASLDRKKIGYSEGAEALFRWFAAQDGMLQSLILGQVDEEYQGQIARMILGQVLTREMPPHRDAVNVWITPEAYTDLHRKAKDEGLTPGEWIARIAADPIVIIKRRIRPDDEQAAAESPSDSPRGTPPKRQAPRPPLRAK